MLINNVSRISEINQNYITPDDKSLINVVEINIHNHNSYLPRIDDDQEHSFDFKSEIELERCKQKSARRITS
jgi:hypothetical protein